MRFTDDSFAMMLLCATLSANREEYARPLSTQEFAAFEERVRQSPLQHLGKLRTLDISGLMMQLDISEEEAYRIYTLLNRSVQLSYVLDHLQSKGIDLLTRCDAAYPQRALRRMEAFAPPILYLCGNAGLLQRPMLAIVGISGVKTGPEVREAVGYLVEAATRLDYTVLTGGERGVSSAAMHAVRKCGGTLVELLGGDMDAHIAEADIAEMLADGQAAVLSLEHPEALFTVSHAISRNKLLFSLATAAFIFNTDGKRGELDVLRKRCCEWVYAWTGFPANRELIAHGAIPVGNVLALDPDELSRHWKDSEAVQLSLFDIM